MEGGQQAEQLFGLARVAEREQGIAGREETEVAVECFGGVQKGVGTEREVSVEAILRPISPLLPMPVTVSLRPLRRVRTSATISRSKATPCGPSSRLASWVSAAASMRMRSPGEAADFSDLAIQSGC